RPRHRRDSRPGPETDTRRHPPVQRAAIADLGNAARFGTEVARLEGEGRPPSASTEHDPQPTTRQRLGHVSTVDDRQLEHAGPKNSMDLQRADNTHPHTPTL